MKPLRVIYIIIFTLATSSLSGQYLGDSPINNADVQNWIPKLTLEYYGVYHFGTSEAESSLILFYTATEIIAQIKSGHWNSEASDWIWDYQNLSNVRIDKKGNFYSDEYSGQFVRYVNNGEVKSCLKIYNSWSGVSEKKDEYELGYKDHPFAHEVYWGDYTIASTQDLNPESLNEMSGKTLKLMRNEIFARYGYVFQSGGEMDKYFRNKSWYKPQHTNVNGFLTAVEKRNISKIQQAEE